MTISALGHPSAWASQQQAIWVGPNIGNWWVTANWEPHVIPNNNANNTYRVMTHPGPQGNGDIIHINQPTTVDQLRIAYTDTVMLPNGGQFTIVGRLQETDPTGLFTLQGQFHMNGTNGATDLRLAPAPSGAAGFVYVGNSGQPGGGIWELSNSINNRIYSMSGGAGAVGLINETGGVIRGAGQIGLGQMRLENRGLIEAHFGPPPNAQLIINLSTPTPPNSNSNSGIIQASNGSLLTIQNSTINNTGGAIRALDGSTVDLLNSTFTGGHFTTFGSGQMRIQGVSRLNSPTNTGMLVVPASHSLEVTGTLINSDSINLNASAALADLRLDSDVLLTATGGNAPTGVVNLSNSINNRIYGINALRRLTVASNQLIRGSGQIGVNSNFALTNEGEIRADQPSTLTIGLTGTQNFNNNLMHAVNGGVLRFIATTLNNTNGVIRAGDGSRVELTSVTLTGGEISTEGSGEVRLMSGDVTFQDVLNNAHIVASNGNGPTVAGAFVNANRLDLNSTGGSTDLRLNSDITLPSGGTINMSNNISNRIYGVNGLRRLTNAAGHLIRGSGHIGVNSNLNLTNNGIIRADQPASMTIGLSAGVNENNNLIEAINGAVLHLNATALNNTNGEIHVGHGSRLDIGSSQLIGGLLSGAPGGTGFARILTADTVLQDVHTTIRITADNGNAPVLVNGLTNDATFEINSTGGSTDLRLNSPTVTIGGEGELVFSNNLNNRVYGINGLRRLVNGENHTIRGAAQIGVNSNFDLTNHGSIVADQSAGMVIDVTNDFANNGLLHASGGNITIPPGAFTNSGQIVAGSGRTISRDGGLTQTAGLIDVQPDGTLTMTGTLNVQGGIVAGRGVTAAAVNNTGGTISPGPSAGAGIGSMVITAAGGYVQGADATLHIQIGGQSPITQHDVFSVQGPATLGGTLHVTFSGGYEPAIGSVFTVISASSLSGQFAQVTGPGLWSVMYRTHNVILTFQGMAPTCHAADINCDGVVNVNDLLAVINGWGACPPPPQKCPADIAPPGGDGLVNVNDLLMVINNWG